MRTKPIVALVATALLTVADPATSLGSPVVSVVNDAQGSGLVTDGSRLFDLDGAVPGDRAEGTLSIENDGAEPLRVTLELRSLDSDGSLGDMTLAVTQGQREVYRGPAGSCAEAGTVEVGALAPGDRCLLDVSAELDPAFDNGHALKDGGVAFLVGAEPVVATATDQAEEPGGGDYASVPRTGDDGPGTVTALTALVVAATTVLLWGSRQRRRL